MSKKNTGSKQPAHVQHGEANLQLTKEEMQLLLSARIKEMENAQKIEQELTKEVEEKYQQKFAEAQKALPPNADERTKQIHRQYIAHLTTAKKLDKDLLLKRKESEAAALEIDKLQKAFQEQGAVRERLEGLYKALDQQLKDVHQEGVTAEAAHEKVRQQLAEKIKVQYEQITTRTSTMTEDRLKEAQENEMLKDKINQLAKQKELRAKQFETELKKNDIEKQLAEARIKQQQQLTQAEEAKAKMIESKIQEINNANAALEKQLEEYGSQYTEVTNILSLSKETLNKYKQEAQRIKKTIAQQEKDKLQAQDYFKQTTTAFKEIQRQLDVEQKKKADIENKRKKLEDLCRAFQAELKELRGQSSESQPQQDVPPAITEQPSPTAQ